ncbi:hypothetical protein OH76DRAFT_216504 [Lentinus brumalis]|uniref:Protein kinase domain-containing protein n=1 Tax=Lentinus brumalis TaxID=2498619 RepID=A0A371CMC2_9APHY|nr:hypothetical protein OH76DRAFT_216504 [Polyporus brumalis]
MRDVSRLHISDERGREPETRYIVHELLSSTFRKLLGGHPSNTQSDNRLVWTYGRKEHPVGSAPLAIVEEKAKLGFGGDGAVQGSFAYAQHWTDPSQKAILDACSCPSFVIALAGPHVVICGALLTSSVVVHRLTDYLWLGQDKNNDDAHTISIARVFYALGRALARLQSFYAGLTPPTTPGDELSLSRFFPLATEYKAGERTVKFKYLTYLTDTAEACRAFRAVTVECEDAQQPREIVVKFVERYGEAAHRLLAAHGLAPELLYYGDIWLSGPEREGCGQRKMVVMEYVKGKAAWVADRDDKRGVRGAVERAVGLLNDAGMVHGDVRLPNIVIADAAEGVDMENRVRWWISTGRGWRGWCGTRLGCRRWLGGQMACRTMRSLRLPMMTRWCAGCPGHVIECEADVLSASPSCIHFSWLLGGRTPAGWLHPLVGVVAILSAICAPITI